MSGAKAARSILTAPTEPPAGTADRRIEMAVYDILLPCRRYEIAYKVAVLKPVTPTLEFLLRLVKAVPGLEEEQVREFFGYSRSELEYVLNEAIGPGYIDRTQGRLWVTAAGESLFTAGSDGPAIFTVEERRSSGGFDLLSVAPERHKALDKLEMVLPDLKLADGVSVGSLSKRIPDRFRRFFRELGDRKDRDQVQRKDLYSIDSVAPGDRYQVPMRVRVFHAGRKSERRRNRLSVMEI